MTQPAEAPKSTYYQAFVRDRFCCVYCDQDILASFDSFAASHLDHLKPESARGPCEDVWNRVTACGVCNSLKGTYDPVPGEKVTKANFSTAVANAKDYIQKKRRGETTSSYFRDYQYWLEESAKILPELPHP
jgi:5-methylcytosine-specific restriction endonuclease McrA